MGIAVEKAQPGLERDKVLQIIRLRKAKFAERYGVTKIGIFGSVAKGLARPGSDVDVVVEMSRPDLFYLVHIKNELEEALGSDVDVLHYRKNMNRFLQKRIQQEAVYVWYPIGPGDMKLLAQISKSEYCGLV